MTTESSTGVIGDIDPQLVIQKDEMACFSACILSEVDVELGLDEQSITDLFIQMGFYDEAAGTGLLPACELDQTLNRIGLSAEAVYDARMPCENEEPRVAERLSQVLTAIKKGQKVVLAYPKRRAGESAFLHYSVVTGITGTEPNDQVILMDPSNVDGGIKRPTWQQFTEYVTPESDVPVMAWGINKSTAAPGRSRLAQDASDLGHIGVELLTSPLFKAEDNGKPIPPRTRHAGSVAMTTYDISYQFSELGDVALSRHGRHPHGYPRFVAPPTTKELSLAVTGRFDSLPFPTLESAQSAAHLENTYGPGTKVTEKDGFFWLPGTELNMQAWQHTGLGISSRQALAALEGRPGNNLEARNVAEQEVKKLIEQHTGANPEDIYLFPTGMAGIYWLNQALSKLSNGAPAVQFGFPYTDTYAQGRYGPEKRASSNMLDFRDGDYDRLQALVDSGQQLRGLITEYPSNPLLATPDFDGLDHIVDGKAPIIIDDTIGTMYNLDDQKLPDSVVTRVTSLTKFFSSAGDVMGGSIVLRPASPHYEQLKQALDQLYEDTLWHEDATVLANNGQQFESIMPAINKGGEELALWLAEEWTGDSKPLQAVHHPSLNDRSAYDRVKKHGGGYGGLMSLRFNVPGEGYSVFDRLRITKGPSLGTFYTLGCLYTWLAHKPVREVERFNVVPDLLRISVGIEGSDDLKERFSEVLA